MTRYKHTLFILITLLSGSAALVYETVWLRWFKILFGSTAYAASATLVAFFAGLTIGALLFGRLSEKVTRPLRIYAIVEFSVIITALAAPFAFDLYDYLYPMLYESLSGNRNVFVAIKFLLAFALLLPPTVMLGGTLPLLTRAYTQNSESLGKKGNRLYSINTLGAAIGSIVGGLVLPQFIGLDMTYGAGMLLTLIVAAMALVLDSRTKTIKPALSSESGINNSISTPKGLILIAAASGFGTLALEVLLMHALSQLFDMSIYSFSSILVVVLFSLGLSAAFVSVTSKILPVKPLLLAALLLQGILILSLPWFMDILLNRFGTIHGTALKSILLAAFIAGPPMFIGGLILPLTFRLTPNNAHGKHMGTLLGANTLGGIIGSICAGFIMLEWPGIWPSIALIGLGYLVSSLFVGNGRNTRFMLAAAQTFIIAVIVLTPANPLFINKVNLKDDEILLGLEEGAHGVVSVIYRPIYNDKRIKLNNHYTLSGSGARVNVERAGHIPLLLHENPEQVAFIGSATGITAGASVLHDVKRIDLIELVPEVQELAAEHFTEFNRAVYDDPRSVRVVEDGNNHLRATNQSYDIVVADLFMPWRPGIGTMYSLDHFQSIKQHLNENGIFCQWLPVFQLRGKDLDTILNTFYQVFPNAILIRGNFSSLFPRLAVIGVNGKWPARDVIEQRIQILASTGRTTDQWITNPDAFWMLYMGPLKSLSSRIEKYTLNTYDLPVFEYQAGLSTRKQRRKFLNKEWNEYGEYMAQSVITLPQGVLDWPTKFRHTGALYAKANTLYNKSKGSIYGNSEFKEVLRQLKSAAPATVLLTDSTASDIKL